MSPKSKQLPYPSTIFDTELNFTPIEEVYSVLTQTES